MSVDFLIQTLIVCGSILVVLATLCIAFILIYTLLMLIITVFQVK